MTSLGPIDTHSHLSASMQPSERDEAVRLAEEAGLHGIIDVGIDVPSSRAAAALAADSPLIFAAVGVHPNAGSPPASLDELKPLLSRPKVVAVGETGLDGYRNSTPRDVQRRLFEQHLSLAEAASLPAIIHSRAAEAECIAVAKSRPGLKAVFHSFTGSPAQAAEITQSGFFVSFTGVVTFPSADNVRAALKEVPIDQLLLETDSPYLAPQPVRGKPNRPSYVLHMAPVIAEVTGYSPEDIIRATSVNARLLFSLGGLPTKPAFAYAIGDSLYLNITNRCSNNCTFCLRGLSDYHAGHYLKLDHEPSAQQVISAIGDASRYKEIVFCGFGEPTENLPVLLEVAGWLKERGAQVRLDTNGEGSLINGTDVVSKLTGLIDKVSVSLNAPDAETYDMLCRSRFGPAAFGSVLEFIKKAAKVLPEVEVTAVAVPGVDLEACKRLAEGLGAVFRKRRLLNVRRI